MKKQIFTIAALIILCVYGCTCNGKKKGGPGSETEDTTNMNIGELHDSATQPHADSVITSVPISKDSALTLLSKEIFTLLQHKEYAKLDSLVHPEDGVRFSPYATIDAGRDRKFSRAEFNALFTTNKAKKYKWGNYDGSGDPIYMTGTEYFKKFVYDGNFVTPGKFMINEFIGNGNSHNNLKTVYAGNDFTESYNSGSKKNGGLDWKAVRLVFKAYNGKYYLVGVVHDQWTI